MLQFSEQPQSPATTKCNVAHIAHSLRTGGMERLLVQFARKTDRSRFDLQFISLTVRGNPADDIESLRWPVTCLGKREGFRLKTVFQLAHKFRKHGINVVHSHNSGAMIYGALAGRLAGVRAIIHTRHGQRFGASSRQNWSFATTSRWIDRMVTVSHDTATQSIKEGVSPGRVCTILNGIDLDRFPLANYNANGPAILVARLVPEKDLPTLLRATSRLIQIHPSFRLQIVGDGPCMQSTRNQIRELHLQDQVALLGERRDIPQLLRNASMFILPSRTEGVSLTLLEAMATGLPVIATRVGGNKEVVEDGQTGILVNPGNAPELAEAIRSVSLNPCLAEQLGLNGRARVENHFNVNHMIHSYENLYREVLTQRHASHLVVGEPVQC